jgi:cell division protein FtsA
LARKGIIAALDVGTTKICCFVAEIDDELGARIIGIGHHASQGLKAGAIIDMEQAEQSIIAAVNAAEQMAGVTIHDVVVSISGGGPTSHTVETETAIGSGAIGDSEIRKLLNENKLRDHPPQRALIHSIPVGYRIDGSNGIRDPRNMHGQTLGVHVHMITTLAGAVQNLNTCIQRCHLNVSAHVVSPYASGLSCLVEDEMDLGVTLIEMGGGTTSFAVFFNGAMVHADSAPVGGVHVTHDIARGLSTPLNHAERLKTLHGGALPSPTDEREIVDAPQIGEDEEGVNNRVPKSFLVSIIAPRLEETLEIVRAKLEHSGMDRVAGRRVVLTGGASQLPGVRELTSQILDKQVRMGRPIRTTGLAEATEGPAFATGAGLLSYAMDNRGEIRLTPASRAASRNGRFGRLGGWFRDNF